MSIKEIYNQGRVVGYSAYEIYVRQHMAQDPTTPPATEREWLASMIGSGSSMLLRLTDSNWIDASDETHQIYEVTLPEESTLFAATTIVGSLFLGSAEWNNEFATHIKDYGPLVANTASIYPNNNNETVPVDVNKLNLTSSQITTMKHYMHILDGVIINKGTWQKNPESGSLPNMDMLPDLNQKQKIRIVIKGTRDKLSGIDIPILLTGFSINSILAGVSNDTGSINTEYPANGDFLGPATIPWASKIVFSVPPAFHMYFNSYRYRRRISLENAGNIATKYAGDSSLVDLASADFSYYDQFNSNTQGTNPALLTHVSQCNMLEDSASVLTVYSRGGSDLPPALYAGVVEGSGYNKKMYPVDTVAPGTTKLFVGDAAGVAAADKYVKSYPGVIALLIDPNTHEVSVYRSSTDQFDIASLSVTDVGSSSRPSYILNIVAGNLLAKTISLTDSSGKEITRSAKTASKFNNFPSTTCEDLGEYPLVWSTLISMLSQDKGLDILGILLRELRSHLPDIQTTGALKLTGTEKSSVGGDFSATGSLQTGKGYIVMGDSDNDIRLYVSNSEPTDSDIPDGSIGIGW